MQKDTGVDHKQNRRTAQSLPIILGKYYVPVQLLKCAEKGDIFLAVSLKNFSFRPCVIKQGKPAALHDRYGRDMKDRLLWQKVVLKDIEDAVPSPGYIDYFEVKNHSYLVIQQVTGTILHHFVKDIYDGKSWMNLLLADQKKLLNLFLQILEVVAALHSKGYVHRDITDSNFIILKDGRLCILDFELTFSLKTRKPEHPFLLGTFGYVAPEQIKQAYPDYAEDIYSLGALLCFILSNTPPVVFIAENLKVTQNKLDRITHSPPLTKTIMACLSAKRADRPGLSCLKTAVTKYMEILK